MDPLVVRCASVLLRRMSSGKLAVVNLHHGAGFQFRYVKHGTSIATALLALP